MLRRCRQAATSPGTAAPALGGCRALLRRPALALPGGNAVGLRARVAARLTALMRAEAHVCALRFQAATVTDVCSAIMALEADLQVPHCLFWTSR